VGALPKILPNLIRVFVVKPCYYLFIFFEAEVSFGVPSPF